MKLLIEMTLQSDAVFGNGLSIPGGEDIATQMDDAGFPYLKGNTFKGMFREELINLLGWTGKDTAETRPYRLHSDGRRWFGTSG